MSVWHRSLKATFEAVVVGLPRRTRAGDRLILAYHNVVPVGTLPRGDHSLHLPFDQFEEQLDAIRSELDVVPLMDLLNRPAPNERRVAITFDDAYATALTHGVKACVQQRMPCTVFVAPGLLGSIPPWDVRAESGHWSNDERTKFLRDLRGLEQCRDANLDVFPYWLRIADESELAAWSVEPLVRFGNHTMRHPNLAQLPSETVSEELAIAAAWLRARFENAFVPVVAYPYGLVPRDAGRILQDVAAGFGLSVSGGWISSKLATDATALPRWNVPAGVSIDGFRMRLRGWLAS